jgi:hypothetical protein
MKKLVIGIIPKFLPLALSITLICGLFYTVIQQNYRMNANDPQIQIAEDIASQLNKGTPPLYYIPNIKIDISKSLGTFISVYDENGKILGSSALLNNKIPQIPPGTFVDTKQKGETRFTWQPQNNVRIALVMVHYQQAKGGYVAIGRSLKEVEIRIDNMTNMVFIGWVFTLFSVFLLLYIQKKLD